MAKKIGKFQHAGNRGSFRAWLYQQARWRIADQFRARARAGGAERQFPIRHQLGEVLHHAGAEGGGSMTFGGRGLGGEGTSDGASPDESFHPEVGPPTVSTVDPAFDRIWTEEWEERVGSARWRESNGR